MRDSYPYYSSYDSSGSHIVWIVLICIVLLFILGACESEHLSSEREAANMVYIKEGYCYDADTKIIHRESVIDGGKYSYDTPVYTPYVNENGNYCKYEYGRWVEFVKTP